MANEDSNPGSLLAFGSDITETCAYMRSRYPYPYQAAFTSMYIPTKRTLNDIDFGGAVKDRYVYPDRTRGKW